VKNPGFADVLRLILQPRRIRRLVVPETFLWASPTSLQRRTSASRRAREILSRPELKAAAEVKKISAGVMMAEVGHGEAIQVLRSAKDRQGPAV